MANSNFENIIKSYLDKRAQDDSLFAQAYQKAGKSIKKCCDYIISQARKIGGNAVAVDDATVYGWAVHYYDEDDVEVNEVAEHVEVSVPSPVPASVKNETVQRKSKRKNNTENHLQLSLFENI